MLTSAALSKAKSRYTCPTKEPLYSMLAFDHAGEWKPYLSASLPHCKQLDITVMDKALSAASGFTSTLLICNVHSDGLL